MRCPVDNSELVISTRRGVEIDYCPTCRGVWLDRGELDKLIAREAEITAETYADFDDDSSLVTSKRKNDMAEVRRPARRVEREVYEDRYDDDDRYDEYGKTSKKRRKSFLGEIFDIFD